MSSRFHIQSHDEMERGFAEESWRRFSEKLRREKAAEDRRKLFGWPHVLRTIAWGIAALAIFILGGAHCLGYI